MKTKKKETCRWEELRSMCTKCLCYSEEKGLYVHDLLKGENPDIIYRPHGYVGLNKDKIVLSNGNLIILIISKFGYGYRKFLRASVQVNNQTLLDFDTSKLYVLNDCSVSTYDVPEYDWNALFEKMVAGYKWYFTEWYTSNASAYIEEISAMLDKDKIFIKGKMTRPKTTRWSGNMLVTLHSGRKIRDLIESLELSNITDTKLIGQINDLCKKYIDKVGCLSIDYEDLRANQISDSLIAIHKFMWQNGAGLDFMKHIFKKNNDYKMELELFKEKVSQELNNSYPVHSTNHQLLENYQDRLKNYFDENYTPIEAACALVKGL